MRKSLAAFTLILLATTACSGEKSAEETSRTTVTTVDAAADSAPNGAAAEQAATPDAPARSVAEPPPITTPVPPPVIARPDPRDSAQASMPELSYSHRYGYEVPGDDIGHVQDAQLTACNALGAARCKLAGFQQNLQGSRPSANLELFVATNEIPTLIDRFSAIAAQYDGKKISATVDSENVTEAKRTAQDGLVQLLDEDKRLRARLADRKLPWRERQAINERLDKITAWIRTARGQLDGVASDVAFTRVSIAYSAAPVWWGSWLAGALLTLLLLAGVIGWLRSRATPPLNAAVPA